MKRIGKVRHIKLGGRRAVGLAEGNSIYLDSRLKGKKHLEILIHEACHILFPDMSEDEVIHNSVELTKALWKERYRRVDNDESQKLQDGSK